MEEKKVPTELAEKNPHPRDADITFDEGPHIYTVYGKQDYTSTTTWIHQQFSHFDPDKVIDGMIERGKLEDPENKYYKMTREEIKEMWRKNGQEASGKGTKMRYDIECFYNGWTVENDSLEYEYFTRFQKDHSHLKPYRTEWIVFHEDIKISGSIDMVFEKPNGNLAIYDWKRCKSIDYENDYGKMAKTKCIEHLPDAKFWHYSLQLNMYKTILQEKYGKTVDELYLVCLHPDNFHKTYELLEVPNLDKEIKDLFEYRKTQIEKQE